ncbi:MAG TPA: iron ABC transporter substrate-binding protein [Acidimicrobiia bacterium]|nr:iron ABC transporter substrate-binding protein [Acidimicrobiia bacterium]
MRRPTVLLAVLALLAACGGGGDAATTTDAPADTTGTTVSEAGAESGGALTLYSGRNERFVQPVVDAFTEETGIEVEVRYAGTGELATTIMTEGDSSPADVFWAQDPAFIGGLAKEGYLTELPEDVLSLVPERFADTEGRWVGITARARVFVYNTDLVSRDELPADIWELTDPKWKGRLGVAPTNGSFVAFVTGMVLSEGEERTREWLEGIADNEPQIFDGNGPIVDAVVAGDLDAGLVNHYYLLQRVAELGEVPAVNHFFSDGDPGGLVMATGAGILASSDQPEQAAELLRYLLSEESQAHFLELFEYPLVEGIGTPEGQLPLDQLPTLDISLTDTADTLDPALALIAESGLS